MLVLGILLAGGLTLALVGTLYSRHLARAFGERFKVPSYGDMHAMMRNEDIDVVSILTPSGLHAQHLLAIAPYKKHVVVEKPLHVAFELATEGGAQHWRLLVVVEESATVTVVEEHPHGVPGYANGVAELHVGANARVEYVTIQNRCDEALHFAFHRASVARDAELDWAACWLGSRLGKTWMQTELTGPGSTGKLTGFYVADGDRHVDLDTTQEHRAPNAVSDLYFKGVLTDRGRSVWRGIITVDEGAQGTDAYQQDRNLMLSPTAHADSIPGLEIKANDVRCTHGATISPVDRQLLFYLMSRGLPRPQAERLIVDGFFADVLARIVAEPVREAVGEALRARLP